MMKKLFWATTAVITAFIFLIIISYLISPFDGGKEIAQRAGIPYPAVIAHRGASGIAPESTVAAYELARDIGANYLEADLQRTVDGVIIVFHDDSPARTTNAAEIFPGREDDFIGSFTYEELMQLDAGSWFNKSFPGKAREEFNGLQIITLNELIDIAEEGNNNPGLYLETKSAPEYPGIEDDIVEILSNRGWLPGKPDLQHPERNAEKEMETVRVNTAMGTSRIIFQSFHTESLEKFKELSPETKRVLLVNFNRVFDHGWNETLKTASELADGIGPAGYLTFPWIVRKAHSENLIVHPYTVNNRLYLNLMWFFGTDGVFTDYPDTAIKFYRIN